jgi:transglycosylase-like protein with SLT domain
MVTTLFSGNPDDVQTYIENTVGLVPLMPVPWILRKARYAEIGGVGYLPGRSALRGRHEAKIKAEFTEANRPQRDEAHAPDEAPARPDPLVRVSHPRFQGEHYIFPKLGNIIETYRAGHKAARTYGVSQAAQHVYEHEAAGPFQRLRISKLERRHERSFHAAAVVAAKYDARPDTIIQTADLVESMHSRNVDLIPDPGSPANAATFKTGRAYLHEHADELKSDARFWELVQAIKDNTNVQNVASVPYRDLGHMVNEARASRDAPLVKDLTERVPKSVQEFTHNPDISRTEAFDMVEQYRTNAADFNARATAERDPEIAKSLRSQAVEQTGYAKALSRKLKGLSRPGVRADKTRSDPWTREMEQEHIAEVKAAMGEEKLGTAEGPATYIPARYPTEAQPRSMGQIKPTVPSGRATHISEGRLMRSGHASADLRQLLPDTLHGPSVQRYIVGGMGALVMRSRLVIEGRKEFNKHELAPMNARGEFPANAVAVPLGLVDAMAKHTRNAQEFSAFLEDIAKTEPGNIEAVYNLALDRIIDEQDRASILQYQKSHKGEKFAIVDANILNATIAQMSKTAPAGFAQKFMHTASILPARVMLNSPGWVEAQIVAQFLPMAAALGPRFIHSYRALELMRDVSKADPHFRALWRGAVGGNAMSVHMSDLASMGEDVFARGAKHRITKGARLTVGGEGLIGINRMIEAKMREFAASLLVSQRPAALARGMSQLLTDIADFEATMRGMTPRQRAEAIVKNPEWADAFNQHLNEFTGNWTSATAFEKKWSGAVLFYPWVRFATQWALYHFPLNHPVTFTTLAFLGQRNAEELEKIGKGRLPSWRDYEMPAVGGNVYPVGTRTSLAGPIQEAIAQGSGNNLGAALIGLTNPLFSGPLQSALNMSSLGYPVPGSNIGYRLLNTAWKYSPALRAAAEKGLGPLPEHFYGFGATRKQWSLAFMKADPMAAMRSFAFAYQPRSAEDFTKLEQMGRLLNEAGTSPTTKQKREAYNLIKSLGPEVRKAFRDSSWAPSTAISSGAAEGSGGLPGSTPSGGLLRPDYDSPGGVRPPAAAGSGGMPGITSSGQGSGPLGFSAGSSGGGGGGISSTGGSGGGSGLGAMRNVLGRTQPTHPSKVTTSDTVKVLTRNSGVSRSAAQVAAASMTPDQRALVVNGGQVARNDGSHVQSQGGPLARIGTAIAALLGADVSQPDAKGKAKPDKVNTVALAARAARQAGGGEIGKGAAYAAPIVLEAAKKYGVSPSLLMAQINTESAFGTNTGPSSAGARGWTQFMPATAASFKEFGPNSELLYKNTPKAVRAQIFAQAHYMAMGGANSGDEHGALLSYNHSEDYAQGLLRDREQWRFMDRGAAKVHSRYANPAPGWGASRTDMGQDYVTPRPGARLNAIGDGTVVAITSGGFPSEGGTGLGLVLKLKHPPKGPHTSPYVYYYEGLKATVKRGDRVKRGQQVAVGDGTSIEIGFAADAGGGTLASAEGDVAANTHYSSAGRMFQRLTGSPSTNLGAVPGTSGVTGVGSSGTGGAGGTAGGGNSNAIKDAIMAGIGGDYSALGAMGLTSGSVGGGGGSLYNFSKAGTLKGPQLSVASTNAGKDVEKVLRAYGLTPVG